MWKVISKDKFALLFWFPWEESSHHSGLTGHMERFRKLLREDWCRSIFRPLLNMTTVLPERADMRNAWQHRRLSLWLTRKSDQHSGSKGLMRSLESLPLLWAQCCWKLSSAVCWYMRAFVNPWWLALRYTRQPNCSSNLTFGRQLDTCFFMPFR